MSSDHHHDEHGDKLLESEVFQKARREMRRTLWWPGVRPDNQVDLTRRIFIHRALFGGTAAAAATAGWLPRINTMDMAYAQEGGATETFRFAWISDTHLLPKEVNTRFVEKAVRAVNDVKAMDPPADFLIFGGDLAQLGDPVELKLGNDIIKELDIKKVFIPGEHDWYLDMGKTWTELYGGSPWTFDHKGVRFIGLDTVSRAQDFWTARNMNPTERMAAMATLDGALGGAWSGLGREQLDYLDKTLSDWGTDRPVVIFTHNPLYEYYPPWNFWVRDWREVHEIVKPYTKITNIHGHTHQVLYNEIGAMRSIGMLATSWPWPYAPEGVPALTKPMVRVDPGDHFDGVGWGKMTFDPQAQRIDHEYMMWRKEVLATAQVDSGSGDNDTTFLSPRPEGR
jgi:predicted MPP superfamily phosphohydrolase